MVVFLTHAVVPPGAPNELMTVGPPLFPLPYEYTLAKNILRVM